MAFCEATHVAKDQIPSSPVFERGAGRRPVFYVTDTNGVVWCLSEEHAGEFETCIRAEATLPASYKIVSIPEILKEIERRQSAFIRRYLDSLKKRRSSL